MSAFAWIMLALAVLAVGLTILCGWLDLERVREMKFRADLKRDNRKVGDQ